MAIARPLSELRTDLRAETGQSLNTAQGAQSQLTQDNQLNRQQLELWEQYEWPHLRYWLDVPVNVGQDTYSYPPSMPFDQVNRIYWAQTGNSSWKPLAYGIRAYDIRPVNPQKGTPLYWGNIMSVDPTSGLTNPVGQVKLLPIPVAAGLLRFEGQAPCNPMQADSDTCILDSKLIVLFAASEMLAVQKQEVAQAKLAKAQAYLRRILANQGADKRTNYNMGGAQRGLGYLLGSRPYGMWVPGIDYIP